LFKTEETGEGMRIAIAGLGRVGTALGILLRRAGHEIVSAYDTAPEARHRFTERVCDTAVGSLDELLSRAELLLIAVPDSKIALLSESLAKLPNLRKPLLVGHTSGAFGSEELHHVAARGLSTFSLHPVQTFASIDSAVSAMPSSYFAVEGAPDAVRSVEENIIASIGGRCIRIDPLLKPLYHASLSVASNFLVTLLNLAIALNAGAGIDTDTGYEMMLPLIETTLQNFRTSGAAALTGPIERADTVTIEKHLSALTHMDESLRRLYIALASATVDLAREKGSIDREQSVLLKAMFRRNP
jgi:predicted short-subunit dehydrogenase-like oxidoreductase (DUF2520 family)